MNVLEIPFNRFLEIKNSTNSDYLLMLDNKSEYHNHLNTVHAAAQFALAEATSGYFLQNEFQQITDVFPVVRKVATKYKKPVQGEVHSKASFIDTDKSTIIDELNLKQRVLITVRVLLFDSENNNVMQSDFEWFVAKQLKNN